MRLLAALIKSPSENWLAYNARLTDLCKVLRPTAARLVIVDQQPKVTLLDAGRGGALRVAVCPQAAHSDDAVKASHDHLAEVIGAALGQPILTQDSDDGRLCLFMWPLPLPTAQIVAPEAPRRSAPGQGGTDGAAPAGSPAGTASPETATPAHAAPATSDDARAAPATEDPAALTGPTGTTPEVQARRQAKQQAGRLGGRPMFGFRGGPAGQEEHPEEGPIVRTILACLDAEMTHDRIDRRLRDEHEEWLMHHWNPRDRPKLIARIIERADWYRRTLPALPAT